MTSNDIYHLGDWLRAWSNYSHTTQMVGYVTGYGVTKDHWSGAVTGQTIILKNARWGAHILPSDIIERIDPVEEWHKLRPGEPIPPWLENHLKPAP